jgi:hypothetical protein
VFEKTVYVHHDSRRQAGTHPLHFLISCLQYYQYDVRENFRAGSEYSDTNYKFIDLFTVYLTTVSSSDFRDLRQNPAREKKLLE